MTDRGRPVSPAGISGRQAHDVTVLLRRWSDGDHQALDQLVPLVEGELRKIAHAYLQRERSGHTLDTGALINEAYARLMAEQEGKEEAGIPWQGRRHFYGIAARVMRQILVDYARAVQSGKRRAARIPLEAAEADGAGIPAAIRGAPEDVLALHEALEALEGLDERQGRIVELMFFGGMGAGEIAGQLETSPATVKRQWRLARAWLRRRMAEGGKG